MLLLLLLLQRLAHLPHQFLLHFTVCSEDGVGDKNSDKLPELLCLFRIQSAVAIRIGFVDKSRRCDVNLRELRVASCVEELLLADLRVDSCIEKVQPFRDDDQKRLVFRAAIQNQVLSSFVVVAGADGVAVHSAVTVRNAGAAKEPIQDLHVRAVCRCRAVAARAGARQGSESMRGSAMLCCLHVLVARCRGRGGEDCKKACCCAREAHSCFVDAPHNTAAC
mmetsp:Transcript_15247/g.44068  ORF Transcript_15247/g.44068 Transcript_15247/m.44068 type:complete len:222 (-) Transcript_15247:21-686(-)